MSSDASDMSSSWFEVLAWIETNKRILIWAGVGALIIVFAAAAYRWKINETEQAANEALLRLHPEASSGALSAPTATPAEYLRVVKEYPKTAAAERAILL